MATSSTSAVATNLPLGLPRPVRLHLRPRRPGEDHRRAQGRVRPRRRPDAATTRANSAWQQLSILAHNLIRSFQLDTLAVPKPRSRKRTYTYLFRSMRTLRFLLIARAGRLTRIGGRNVLRLAHNPATEALYASIDDRLAA